MKMKKIIIIVMTFALMSSIAIAQKNKNITMENQTVQATGDALVEIKTSVGDITIRLYGETPKHRDNFLKLVNDGFYNDVLFHRVINKFMIQTGDPESKGAPAGKMLGAGGPGYDIDAEIVYPQFFHKRGALAAARQGDEVNPDRRSSGSQFYIVTGKVYNASQLGQMEKQLQMQQMQAIFNDLASQHRDSIMAMRRNRDQAGLQALQDELVKKTEAEAAKNPVKLTDAQREAYTTVGGTPHLDGTYTVFGEVVEGMDIVAKIETTATGAQDRPKEDIKIISMKVIK
jgi:peptidylprolyl isomerase/peptidyl-prolyl cis-trans isomerase B (cyclophilin B)